MYPIKRSSHPTKSADHLVGLEASKTEASDDAVTAVRCTVGVAVVQMWFRFSRERVELPNKLRRWDVSLEYPPCKRWSKTIANQSRCFPAMHTVNTDIEWRTLDILTCTKHTKQVLCASRSVTKGSASFGHREITSNSTDALKGAHYPLRILVGQLL